MMKDEQVTAASRTIEISGKEFEVYPLTDRDLDSLTNWIRYKLKKDARAEAEFAESRAEKAEIKRDAAEFAANIHWFDSTGISTMLQTPEGLIKTLVFMLKKQWKEESFQDTFGSRTKMTEEQLINRAAVQQAFVAQNTVGDEKPAEPPAKRASKAKKKSVS